MNQEAIHKRVVLARRERDHGREARNGGRRERSLVLTLQAIALRALERVLRDPQENLLTLARVVNRAALLTALHQERLPLALLKRKTHAKRAKRSPVLLLSLALLHAPLLILRNARNLSLALPHAHLLILRNARNLSFVLHHALLLMSRNARNPSLALHHAHLLSRNARNPSLAHLLLRSARSPFLALL